MSCEYCTRPGCHILVGGVVYCAFCYQIKPVVRKLRICFDVDGVLADDTGNLSYEERLPLNETVELVRKLKAEGHTIILQTARYMNKYDGNQLKAHQAGYLELRDWCTKHNIPYDELYLGKASAHVYIDDRGCRFTTVDETRSAIARHANV